MNINFKNSFKLISFLFIISFLVIYLFSIGTSPFYGNYYTGDSSIFITIGKAMKEGKIVYKELFDHKGPILFFIQMLGQYICEGKFGIFILEVLFLFITNIFLYKTVSSITTHRNSLISIIISMVFMSYFIETGNYSEEYSLPFIAICLYLAIKWLKGNNQFSNKINLYSFIYGLCFGIIAFIRLNNAALICGLLLAITIIFIKNKKFLELIKSALFFILGTALVCLPIFIYFYKVDAIYDMLYGTFIHNFMYVGSNVPTNFPIMATILLIILFTALLVLNCKKNSNFKDYCLVLIICYISILIAINIGIRTYHYSIISIPLIAIFMPSIIEIFTSKNMNYLFKIFAIFYICLTYILGCFIPQLYHKLNFKNIGLEDIPNFINKNIEEINKDKILAMGMFTAPIYLYGDFLPCYKYAFMQDYLFISNPETMEETYNYIKSRNVKYILYVNLDKVSKRDYLQEFIFQNYLKKDSITFLEVNQLSIQPREVVLYELK